MIDIDTYWVVVHRLAERGFADDIDWAENIKPPADAEEFAAEIVFVICNSGMKNTVARAIYERVMPVLRKGTHSAMAAFGHEGKATAMDSIWNHRQGLFDQYMRQETDEARLDMIVGIPWIGHITKYHLVKNFGAQVAKPDVHLQRLADIEACTAQALCERLSAASGHKIATVDTVLWRACAEGIINSRTGELA